METLFRLAAVRAEIPIELMSRPTVRSKLGLPQKGDLASHTASAIRSGDARRRAARGAPDRIGVAGLQSRSIRGVR